MIDLNKYQFLAYLNRIKNFMSKNTSITLGKHFENLIRKSIQSGRYSSVSEVVRAGLRLLEKEESKIQALRNAIEAGEESGYVENFDAKQHLSGLKKKYT
jgi:antitoxin ParD1/3/4